MMRKSIGLLASNVVRPGAAKNRWLPEVALILLVGVYADASGAPLEISRVGFDTLWTAGVGYTGELKAVGGSGDYSWTLSSTNSANTWNAVSSGKNHRLFTISSFPGNPPSAGTDTFFVSLADNNSERVESTLVIVINPALGAISGACPTNTTVNKSITPITYHVTGGTTPRTWSMAGQPPGISIDPATGELSGTPTRSGTFDIIIHVVDGAGVDSSKICSWVINPALGSISGGCPPEWTIGRLIAPIQYSVQGGTPPYQWRRAVALPLGVVFDTAVGKLSGTPAQAGIYQFSLRVTDGAGESDSLLCSWTINSLPEILGNVSTAWTAGKGVDPPLTYSRSHGTSGVMSFDVSDTLDLPAGIIRRRSSNGDTLYLGGVISSGAAGTFVFSVDLVDGAGAAVERPCTLKVNPWTRIDRSSRPPRNWDINIGLVHQYAVIAGSGTSPLRWSKGPAVRAAWLQVDGSGMLTGVPNSTDTGWAVFYSKVCDFRNACDSVCDSIFVSKDRFGPEVLPGGLQLTQRNDSAVLTISAKDRGAVDSAYVIWRLGDAVSSDSSIVPLTISSNAGDTLYVFSAAVARKTDADVYGLEFKFRLLDGNNPRNQSLYPSNGNWMSGAPRVDPERFDRSVSAFASDDTLWHLISFPGVYYPDSVRVKDVLGALNSRSEPNGESTDRWRLVEYEPSVNGSEGKVLWHDDDTISGGKGYWFRQFGFGSVVLHLPIQYPFPTIKLFPIALDSGWNLVGSPFFFGTRIDSISPGVNSLYGQRTGASPSSSDWWKAEGEGPGIEGVMLEPWKGYAVNCATPGGCTIYLNPHASASPAPRDTAGLWQANIRLISNQTLLGTVTVGVATTSSNGFDQRDLMPVPMFASIPSLILKSGEDEAFTRNFRSEADDLHVWDIDVSSDLSESHLGFAWEAQPLRRPGYSLIFRDVLENRTIDMTADSVCVLSNCAQIPDGRFKVYYGPTAQVSENIQSVVTLRPVGFQLFQSFPNPFNPSTTILFDLPEPSHVRLDIFNILGQVVTTVLDEERGTGSYSVVWNGRDPDGRSVASGIYFGRLTAGDFKATIRMLLIR